MSEWYYVQDNQQRGPVETSELQQLVAMGELKPTDTVWKKGFSGWVAANTVPGLVADEPSSSTKSNVAPSAISSESRGTSGTVFAQAWMTIRSMFIDPINGVAESHAQIGEQAVRLPGLILMGAYFVLVFFGWLLLTFMIESEHRPNAGMVILKILLLGTLPVGCTILTSLVARSLARSDHAFDSDCFVAGATSVATGVTLFLGCAIFFLAKNQLEAIYAPLVAIHSAYATLVLFGAFTRIYRLPEKNAAVAVLINLVILSEIFTQIFVIR